MPQDAWWRESRVLPNFQTGAEWLRTWLPDAVSQRVKFDPAVAAEALLPALQQRDEAVAPEADDAVERNDSHPTPDPGENGGVR
jgi:membrane protein required for colicin V production